MSYETEVKHWQALRSWYRGGFIIGWEFGLSLSLLFPKGFFGPFMEVKGKILDLAKWIGQGILGPLCGVIFAIISLIPGIIEGAYLNRSLYLNQEEWIEDFVSKHAIK